MNMSTIGKNQLCSAIKGNNNNDESICGIAMMFPEGNGGEWDSMLEDDTKSKVNYIFVIIISFRLIQQILATTRRIL